MKRFLISAALLAAVTATIQAHTLDGSVKDNKTGEPLIGTVIRVKELPEVTTTTGLDGTFTLHELPNKGKFTLTLPTRLRRLWWMLPRKTNSTFR